MNWADRTTNGVKQPMATDAWRRNRDGFDRRLSRRSRCPGSTYVAAVNPERAPAACRALHWRSSPATRAGRPSTSAAPRPVPRASALQVRHLGCRARQRTRRPRNGTAHPHPRRPVQSDTSSCCPSSPAARNARARTAGLASRIHRDSIPRLARCMPHAVMPTIRLEGSWAASKLATIPCNLSRSSHPNADSSPLQLSGTACVSAKSRSILSLCLSSITRIATVNTAPADGDSSAASMKCHTCSPAIASPSRWAASRSSNLRRW